MSGDHHGHSHGAARAGARHAGRLRWAFLVIGALFLVEAFAGVATGSLALLSDAGHMFTDVIGLGMSLAAVHLATRGTNRNGRSSRRT